MTELLGKKVILCKATSRLSGKIIEYNSDNGEIIVEFIDKYGSLKKKFEYPKDINNGRLLMLGNRLTTPAKELHMIATQHVKSLYGWLDNIKNDFDEYYKLCYKPCKLSHIFNNQGTADYNDINIQQFYLLRFAFAYAYENKLMYDIALSNLNLLNSLKVVSIGCGSGIDLWSLILSANKFRINESEIEYTGIDIVNWKYKFNFPQAKYLKENAANYLERADVIGQNIIIFPRSIGDFSPEDFDRIKNAFSTKTFESDELFLLISLRKGEKQHSSNDLRRIEALAQSINKNFTKSSVLFQYYGDYSGGFNGPDWPFVNPSDIIEFLSSLECPNKASSILCNDCGIGKYPILNKNKLSYIVIKFERS